MADRPLTDDQKQAIRDFAAQVADQLRQLGRDTEPQVGREAAIDVVRQAAFDRGAPIYT